MENSGYEFEKGRIKAQSEHMQSILPNNTKLMMIPVIGVFVEDDLNDIIENNKTNNNKKIAVKYNETETSEPDEIADIKKSMDLNIYYEIILDYDNDGFITTYTIEDK